MVTSTWRNDCRFCSECHGLSYNGFPADDVCPAGGQHTAAAIAAGTSNGPAIAAGSTSATLSVSPGNPHQVWVRGLFEMSQFDAQGYINNGARIYIALWGDDPTYDDLLVQSGPPPNVSLWASSAGLNFSWGYLASSSLLNEDWGRDELYATVLFVDVDGNHLNDVESNRVYGNY